MKRLALIAAGLVGLAACAAPEGPAQDAEHNGIEFIDVTHPTFGTQYRCLWSFEQLGYAGGAGLWCERLPVTP